MTRLVHPHFVTLLFIGIYTSLMVVAPAQAVSDLGSVYHIISPQKLVDLTHSFGPETPD